MRFRGTALGLAALVMAAAAAPAQAAKKDITWNIKTAGDFMRSAVDIESKADKVSQAPKRLKKYKLTSYRQFHRRFKEDLDFLIAVNKTHVFIAFRGTTYTKKGDDAHTKLNNDGRPNLEHGHRVHTGWWRAAGKAWRNEVRPVLKDKGKGRKIIITGTSMGGAVAAYVTQHLLHDSKMKKWPVRLVTFAAPRYTFSRNFFPKRGAWYDENLYVYTVEATKKNKCVDLKIYEWQKALRKSWALGGVDLAVPKNKKGDHIWYGRCKTGVTNYDDVHSANLYHGLSQGKTCNHIELRSNCKTYKSYVD